MNPNRKTIGQVLDESTEVAFEDFPEGRVCWTHGLTVTEAHVVSWAGLTGDWYPLHMDEEFARKRGPFGQRVAHGPLIFALSVGLMAKTGVFGNAILAWLGSDELRAIEPVFLGDTLRLKATVTKARRSSSNSLQGIVSFEYCTLNQDDRTVMSCSFNLLMRARSEDKSVGCEQ